MSRDTGNSVPVAANENLGQADEKRSALRVWKWHLLSKLWRFLLVGGAGVLVNSAALFFLHQILHLGLVVASLLAVEFAIAHNFFWNNRWTFEQKRLSFRRFFTFNLISLGGLVITTSTLWGLVSFLGTPYLLANLAGISLATTWNFVMSLFWTWGKL